MPGRRLKDERDFTGTRFDDPVMARRRAVLRETVAALADGGRDRLAALAARNLSRWANEAPRSAPGPFEVRVVPDDWGVAALALTRAHGECCAVLNMANAFVPGGAYVEGTSAQEENLFRRSDCHAAVADEEMDERRERYTPAMTALLSARDGVVGLDVGRPRVCFRGPEDRRLEDLGYAWLPDDEVFPFFELRAAAVDLRTGGAFDPSEAARRIRAQLVTLRRAGVRRVVLSAFGCGAFHNPAPEVAKLYREALAEVDHGLATIVFAVFHPGYGPDNFTPFADAFRGSTR